MNCPPICCETYAMKSVSADVPAIEIAYFPVNLEQAQGLLTGNGPVVCFVSRSVAEHLTPPSGSHLIAVSDSAQDAPAMDQTRWAGVSYPDFVEGEYDAEQVRVLRHFTVFTLDQIDGIEAPVPRPRFGFS